MGIEFIHNIVFSYCYNHIRSSFVVAVSNKRDILEHLTEKGLYPYSKFYLKRIKAGIKRRVRLYNMRDMHATYMAMNKADIFAIQIHMGHSYPDAVKKIFTSCRSHEV